jgi:hypothetical protein
MILAWLLLLTGLTISAVAIYYSVVGLTAIFAAAAIPIVVMGTTLELAKLVCASWLKANWERIPILMKTYMTVAVVVLMLITSMGIFGFLSKAHLDNNLISGDVVDKVAILDEKIKTQRDNIEAARKALIQMDSAVDQTMARSTTEQGADKAANLRRAQSRERGVLQNEISKAQGVIAKLNEERAPIAKDLRKVEAEVGPIKYIAKLIYGDDPTENILEKAVTWVIITIVIVFDPLAVIMLLAAQMTFGWYRKKPTNEKENKTWDAFFNKEPAYEADDGPLTDDQIDALRKAADAERPTGKVLVKDSLFDAANENIPADARRFEGFPWVFGPSYNQPTVIEDAPSEEVSIVEPTVEEPATDKELYDTGKIDNLDWETVEKLDSETAEEDSKKKNKYMIRQGKNQIIKTKE